MIDRLTLGIPNGSSSGNNLVAVVFSDHEITPPGGWTEFQHSTAGGIGGVFYSAAIHNVTAGEIAAGTTWTWLLAATTGKAGYDMFNFRNVTGLNTVVTAAFTSPVTSMATGPIAVNNNQMCFIFWITMNPALIIPPAFANVDAAVYARGELSQQVVVFPSPTSGTLPAQTATLDVPCTGTAVIATINGAGAHIASSTGGTLA